MLQPVLLPTADENKRQYPIDFMLERRISHNPQASSPHVIHEQPTLSAQMGNSQIIHKYQPNHSKGTTNIRK